MDLQKIIDTKKFFIYEPDSTIYYKFRDADEANNEWEGCMRMFSFKHGCLQPIQFNKLKPLTDYILLIPFIGINLIKIAGKDFIVSAIIAERQLVYGTNSRFICPIFSDANQFFLIQDELINQLS